MIRVVGLGSITANSVKLCRCTPVLNTDFKLGYLSTGLPCKRFKNRRRSWTVVRRKCLGCDAGVKSLVVPADH